MEYKSLKELSQFIKNGATIKQDGTSTLGYPITRIETLADDKFNRDRMGYAGITDLTEYANYVLENGDILYSHINGPKQLGRAICYEKQENETIIHGMNLLNIRIKKDLAIPKYVEYYLHSQNALNFVAQNMKRAVNQASIPASKVAETPIVYYSLVKQQEIVSILDTINNIIDADKKQLELLDEAVKSRFIEMFEGKSYPILKWNDVFNTKTGKLDSNAMVEGGQYPFFTCAKEIFAIDKYAFDQEALLLAGNNAAGKYDVKYYKGKFNAYQRTYVLDLKQNWSYQLFKYQLEDKLEWLREQSKGCNTRYITLKILAELEFVIPPIELQNEFESFVKLIDKSKFNIQQHLNLMQELLDKKMDEFFGE